MHTQTNNATVWHSYAKVKAKRLKRLSILNVNDYPKRFNHENINI